MGGCGDSTDGAFDGGVDAGDSGFADTDGHSDASADTGESTLPAEYYRAVPIVGPDDPLASYDNAVDIGGRLLGNTIEGVRYSDDGGASWTPVPAPFAFPTERVHGGFVYNPSTGSVFVFSTSFRLYRSDDRGETFTELTSPFAINGSNVGRVAVVADDGAVWVLARRFQYSVEDFGLAVSADDGASFEPVTLPFDADESDTIAASHGVELFAGPAGSVFLSVNKEALYRRTRTTDWERVEGVTFVLQHFVTNSGVVLISFRELNTYKLALSTDGGQTFTITTESEASVLGDTFAELENGTLLRVDAAGQLRVLSTDGTSWDVVVAAYPEDHESSFVTQVRVDGDTVTLAFEFERLRWTQGDDAWTPVAPPARLPIGSRVLDITVTESGRAAVLVSKNNRGVVYVSDDAGATWRLGQRFNEGVLTLAMKPEGDHIFVGGVSGRYWLLDGDGFLPETHDVSAPNTGFGGFPLLQSAWTPFYGRNSYLLVVGANPEDTDGGLYRLTFYTSLGDLTEIDPLRDPQNPTRDNPAGMRSVQYSGTSVTVGLRQYVGGLARQDRLMMATELSDWSDSPTRFDDQTRPVSFGTPRSLTSRTSDACRMFGQLYSDGRLFNGAFPVEIIEGFAVGSVDINDVECGPGGAWWIGTNVGLYRLEPVSAPE